MVFAEKEIIMYKLDMKEMYQYYNDNVSHGNYPISLELSHYLYDLCWKIKPGVILDRGTGFSSFVFRKYALASNRAAMLPPNGVRIYSVDNKEQWLNKTKGFLKYCGLIPDNFYPWARFMELKLNKLKFDLILEDYDFTMRTKTLHTVIDMLARNGYLILDDANNKRYKSTIIKSQRRHNVTVSYLLKETKDRTGRHAALMRWKR